jgi:pimeloyl-ACP methyl ester carboxylesterase
VNRITSAERAHRELLELVWKRAKSNVAYQRYYASVRFADPKSLKAWARSSVKYTGESRAGQEYAALECSKIYIWGDKSITPSNRKFIDTHRLRNFCIRGSGHWPMLDQTEKFYRIIGNFISGR